MGHIEANSNLFFNFPEKKRKIRLGALIRLIALSLSLDEIKTIFSLDKVVLSTE